MSESASQLIQAFSALSSHERHSVLIELARIVESDDIGLVDDELVFGGEQLFAMYDAEEAQHGDTQTR